MPEPQKPVKVTVSDPTTGEVLGEQQLENDYLLVVHGNTYLAYTNASPNGTHVLTIKKGSDHG